MKKFALVVVDMQMDFLDQKGGKLPVIGSDKLVSPTNKLIDLCAKSGHFVVFTRDSHPRNHVSFRTLGEHCIAESEGALLHRDLNLAVGKSVILNKGMNRQEDTLSAFGATDGFFSLDHFLDERGITDVLVVGVGLDGCVSQTAIEAVGKNFNSYVVTDITKARTSVGFKKAYSELPTLGVNLVTLKEALKMLKVSRKQVQNV